MGIRTNVSVAVQAGDDNDLAKTILDLSVDEVLDTMQHGSSFKGSLDPAETGVVIPLGDVASPRFVAIVADREIDIEFGGSAHTSAAVTGVGATFPTGFAGGEQLTFSVDGTPVTATFDDADESIAQVVARLNAAAALAGLATPVWANSGGQLALTSKSSGSGSTVSVTASAVATALGFTGGASAAGSNATPGTSKISLQRMADSAGIVASELKAYAVLSVRTSSVTISNPSATASVGYVVAVIGDLAPESTC